MTKEGDILNRPVKGVEDVLDDVNVSGSCSIQDIEQLTEQLIKSLPKINRSAWRLEMEDMVVPLEKNPTTFAINDGLAKAQGFRDRLSEMLMFANNEYRIRKRCMEMLFDAVNLISKASSADKRRGEATLKYPLVVIQVEAAEIFVKEIESLLANMRSTSELISRQASVIGMQITLGERRPGNTTGKNFMEKNAEEVSSSVNGQKDWDNF